MESIAGVDGSAIMNQLSEIIATCGLSVVGAIVVLIVGRVAAGIIRASVRKGLTTMHTPDNVRIVVPNASVYGQTIKNFTANDPRRNDLVIGISYADDIGRAVETISRCVTSDSRFLKNPEPVIAVAELADSAVNIVVRPWCRTEDYWDLRFDLTRRIKEQIEAAGCSIPLPQRDVHLHQVGGSAA